MQGNTELKNVNCLHVARPSVSFTLDLNKKTKCFFWRTNVDEPIGKLIKRKTQNQKLPNIWFHAAAIICDIHYMSEGFKGVRVVLSKIGF